jgi:hypothetical protein
MKSKKLILVKEQLKFKGEIDSYNRVWSDGKNLNDFLFQEYRDLWEIIMKFIDDELTLPNTNCGWSVRIKNGDITISGRYQDYNLNQQRSVQRYLKNTIQKSDTLLQLINKFCKQNSVTEEDYKEWKKEYWS